MRSLLKNERNQSMYTKIKFSKQRIIAGLLAVILIFSAFPLTTMAAPASDIPSEMLENSTLDALEYTGFKLQALKDAGLIYKSGGYGSSISSSYLSGIGYDTGLSGKETVANSGTVTGRAPDITRFRNNGLCCASYVSYYFLNYLPNIKGIDTSFVNNAITATGTNSQAVITWVNAGNAMVSAGKARKITNESQLNIGDVVIFENGSTYPHVAIYAGYYNNRHFVTHVGNDRGPEFSTIEGMGMAGDKSSYFAFAFNFPDIPHFGNKGTIEVYKKDPQGRNLSGAIFQVKDSSGNPFAILGPTDANGYASLPKDYVPYDTYTITETTFPKNHTSNGTSTWTVTLNSATPNGTITINAVNKLKSGYIEINKKDSTDGRNLSGAIFTAYNSVGTAIATIGPTNSSGYAKSGAIPFDPYNPITVKETTVPTNYQQPTQQWTVWLNDDSVGANLTYTLNITNNRQYGSIAVTKTAEDGFKENFSFRLQGTSVYGTSINMTANTNSSGVATFSNVEIGNNFTISEINTNERYVIPPNQTAVISWNTVTNKSFENKLKKFTVNLIKKDNEKGHPQGDGSLANAKYGLFKGSELIDTYFTGPDGSFTTVKEYICDKDWSLRELEPSMGYLLDPAVHHVGAEPGNFTVEHNPISVNVTEQIIKSRLTLIKHSDNGSTQLEHPETGVVFQMYLTRSGSYSNSDPDERDILTVDKYGLAANTKDMVFGLYTIHQESGWEGKEKIPDFNVYLSEQGEMYYYIINNAPITAMLRIEKRDGTTGKIVKADGIGFEVYAPDGTKIVQHLSYPQPHDISTFYTVDGWLMLPQSLDYGKGFKLVEVQTVPPYFLGDPVYFDVDGSEKVITVVQYNMPQTGIIHIDKTGEVFASVTENNGVYKPVYEIQGLSGAIIDFYSAEDVVINGDIKYRKNQLVSTVTTTKSGGKTTPLYPGLYYYVERSVPFGMVSDGGEKHYVEIVYGGQTVKQTLTTVSLYNERQKVKISFDKVMEQDELFKLGMNGEIAAVRMGLYAGTDLVAADGKLIPKGGLLEIVSVDIKSGRGTFLTDLPVGASVFLQETETDKKFILDDTKYEVVFEYAGADIPLVELIANNGKPITNKIVRGRIEGLKLDEDGNGLDGALIGLFAPDAQVFDETTALMTVISSEDGSFSFEDVASGNWLCVEIASPESYVLSDEKHPVTISEQDEIITIEMTNRLIRGSARVVKLDKEYPDNKLSGAVFDVFADVNKNGVYDEGIDLLTGTLTEIETGVYQLDGLFYNGYFLHERTSPAFFVRDDNYYYFEIRTDGEIVNVENEAGVGFLNQPAYGELWLTKTDVSNGELIPNCGIRIKDEFGNTVVEGRTDENGIVKFRLRAGKKYTYSEFDCPGYILDETEYPFEITEDGEIIKAEMTNKPIPVPDVPKTGDNSNMYLWVGLMSISAVGVLLTLKRGKKYKTQ